MNIKDYVKLFNKPYDNIKSEYKIEFQSLYEDEKEWLCNLENKLHLLKEKKDEIIIKEVIEKIKGKDVFTSKDTDSLSLFIGKINTIVLIANRINNFKEGTVLENGSKLKLPDLFNELKKTALYSEIDITLNQNLNNFLPHLFSIIKHCQNPVFYPIYYKYWKNILREVLNVPDDYDSMCNFYRKFPEKERQLNFATYLGTIGLEIAKQIIDYDVTLKQDSKEYKYLKKEILNIERYGSILDKTLLRISKNKLINMKEKFKLYITENNTKGSQKASSYIRSIELLDIILNSKSQNVLEGFKSIYNITSPEIISKLYQYILDEQNKEHGIFENEVPISYWRNKFYSAAIKCYLDFIKIEDINDNSIVEIQTKFNLSTFHKECSSVGLKYSNQLITRYVSSLATKPFVLLSGLSGSGKTKLAQSFAQWICEDEKQYCMVPVGADWTNREPLLGYVNALETDKYILPENGALQLIIEANKEENKNKPYFLILDEMNLSHVERYFADFLSVMESKDKFKLHSNKEQVKSGVPFDLSWPKNLFVVGTVNIDETTYMFSPKVLDRANAIEFRVTEKEISNFLKSPNQIDLTQLESKGANMAADFIKTAKNNEFEEINTDNLNDTLVNFFGQLQKTGAEFGYRTGMEIHRLYQQLTIINEEISENEKIDIAVMQKLLPKLHGSRRKLCPILETLGNICVKDIDVKKDIFENEDFKLYQEVDGELALTEGVLYPLSLEKITRMYKGAIDNGFASYAEA